LGIFVTIIFWRLFDWVLKIVINKNVGKLGDFSPKAFKKLLKFWSKNKIFGP
jgi:hypothetical protein